MYPPQTPLITFRRYLDEARDRKYEFSSTHILLPTELAQSVIHWGREEIPEEDLFRDPQDASFGRDSEPHITVLYGLLNNEPDKLRYFFSTQKSVPVKLGRISVFTTNEKFDVIKIEVTSTGLRELHQAMSEKFPNHQSFPGYRPHVTVAYVTKGKGKRFEGSDFFLGQDFRAKEVVFSSRAGQKSTLTLGKSKAK